MDIICIDVLLYTGFHSFIIHWAKSTMQAVDRAQTVQECPQFLRKYLQLRIGLADS